MNGQVEKLLARVVATELEAILAKPAAKRVAEHVAQKAAPAVIEFFTRKLGSVLGQEPSPAQAAVDATTAVA